MWSDYLTFLVRLLTTHGNTYREAAMAGEEVLELMLSGGCNSFQALAELEQ